MALSDTAIRNAKPDVKPVRLFDGGGLYVEVAPSGGKEKRLSLGTYPDVSLKAARARRELARQQLAEGEDPSALRKAAKATKRTKALNTLEVVSRAWLEHRSSAWVARTRTMIKTHRSKTTCFPNSASGSPTECSLATFGRSCKASKHVAPAKPPRECSNDFARSSGMPSLTNWSTPTPLTRSTRRRFSSLARPHIERR